MPNKLLFFAGTSDPCAVVQVQSIGGECNRVAAKIAATLKGMGIQSCSFDPGGSRDGLQRRGRV